MAHLITGYAGSEHIQSKDHGAFNAALFGSGQYVLQSGNNFSASIIDNNTVRVLDGDLLMYGRHIRIEPDTYEDMVITTGTAGMNRIDLICMTYEKNSENGTEKAYLQVIKGAETEGTATAPDYVNADILKGASVNQMPLYKVNIEGVVLQSVEAVFLMNYPLENKLNSNGSADNTTVTFTTAETLSKPSSGSNLTKLFAVVAKAISDLINHLADNVVHHSHTNKTVLDDTTAAYTSEEKTKLEGIAAGAQVNAITGVKGSAESSYRTGEVTITAANIGLGNVDNTADSTKSVKYATTAGTANAVSWDNVTGQPSSYTPSGHNQPASTITTGTLAGQVQANASAAATVTNAQVRDIYAGTDDMTAGTTALASGTIYCVYE